MQTVDYLPGFILLIDIKSEFKLHHMDDYAKQPEKVVCSKHRRTRCIMAKERAEFIFRSRSHQFLTGCHYRFALSDGSIDE